MIEYTTSISAIAAALRSTARADYLVISFPNADAIQIPAGRVRSALAALKGPHFAELAVTAQPYGEGHVGWLKFRWPTGWLVLKHQDHVMVKKGRRFVSRFAPAQRGAVLRLEGQAA